MRKLISSEKTLDSFAFLFCFSQFLSFFIEVKFLDSDLVSEPIALFLILLGVVEGRGISDDEPPFLP